MVNYPHKDAFPADANDLFTMLDGLDTEIAAFDRKHRPMRVTGNHNELWAVLDALSHLVGRTKQSIGRTLSNENTS